MRQIFSEPKTEKKKKVNSQPIFLVFMSLYINSTPLFTLAQNIKFVFSFMIRPKVIYPLKKDFMT